MINTATVYSLVLIFVIKSRDAEKVRSDSIEVGGMVFRELNNSLIFFFLLLPQIFQLLYRCFPFISLSPSFFLFSMRLIAASSFCDSVKYTHHAAATQDQCSCSNKRKHTGTCFNKYQQDRLQQRTFLLRGNPMIIYKYIISLNPWLSRAVKKNS